MITLIFVLIILSMAVNILLVTGCLNFNAKPDALENPSPSNKLARRTQRRKNANVMTTLFLLFGANMILAMAWYGHLKFESWPLALAIVVSWLVALPEYIMQVTANRMGYAYFTAGHLKALQIVLTSAAFILFVKLYFDTDITWRQAGGMSLVIVGALLILLRPRLPECPEQRGPAA